MAALTVSLFGAFHANLDGQEITAFRTNKVQALLICLAAEPKGLSREALLTLLWPGMPERSARHNLRQSLYRLRSILPDLPAAAEKGGSARSNDPVPFTLANRQILSINPKADVDVDLLRMEQLLAFARNHNHVDVIVCPDCQEWLGQAVDLYHGDFLADFYLDDSEEFEQWAEAKRAAYRRQILDALETLTSIHLHQKAYPEARLLAEQQIDIDNLRESAYRQYMEILALSGHRSEAIAAYEQCKRYLAEELGMAPSARTTQLYKQIQDGDLSFESTQAQGVRGYELKQEIGQGAYGAIHLAIQPAVGREVAVKVIRRRYANDPEFIRRFEAEAQTVARLEHPYIVPLYDYWRDPEGAYLVMRYLRGGSLLSSLEGGPWDLESTLKMLDQVAAALAVAHHQGVVHRDIKPANILLDESGNAYLSDFGIAKDLIGETALTAAGVVFGTPDYISPEQIKSEPVGPGSDIYSLGAVLYETLTGERPYPDTSLAELIHKHLTEPIPLVSESRPDLPAAVNAVIQRATAKEPADRYLDVLEMADAFRRAVSGADETFAVTRPGSFDLYNPYKGLRAFQEADAGDFFGRETLVDALVARLTRIPALPHRGGGIKGGGGGHFLAVVGPSGSGKSSVVKAGLLPALREAAIPGSDKWFVAEMVPGTHPFEELELALWPIAVDPPPSLVEPMRHDERGLLRTIRRILPNEPDTTLLLVIDQFEELFTLVDDEERRGFFIDSLLAALSAPRTPMRVIITLRADFYDRPLAYPELGELVKTHTEVILPLTGLELTWAIQEPAANVGVRLEKGLVPAVVADVSEQPGGLPLLQYALTELFETRQNGLMTLAAYEQIGGVSGALGIRADEIYHDFSPGEQEAARQLFLRLVTLGEGVEDTRRRVLRSELEALETSEVSETSEVFDAVVTAFGAARLLTFDHDPVSRQPTVEVAHEALLREWARLRSWLDQSRNDVRMQRLLAQAAGEWEAAGQDTGFLLREARLDQFAGWAAGSTVALTGKEQTFLEASTVAREARLAEEEARRRRELETAQKLAETEHERAEEQEQAAGRLRRRAYILGGVLIVAAVLAIAAIFFANQSNQNAASAAAETNQRATAQAFAEEQQAAAEEQRGIAVVEAESRATAQAEAEANEAVAIAQQATAQAEADFRATAEAVANEERLLAEELRQAALVQASIGLASQSGLELNGNNPERAVLLALEALENYPYTWQAERALGQAVFASHLELILPHEGPVNAVRWSPDETRVLTASSDGTARVWDAASGELLFIFDHEDGGEVYTMNWSPSGDQVTTVAANKNSVYIWNTETGQLDLTFEGHQAIPWQGAWSPSGDRILSTSLDQTARIWDAASGEEITTFTGHDDVVHACTDWGDCSDDVLVWSPDGNRVLTNDEAGEIFVWDPVTGDELLHLSGHEEWVNMAAWSPDGRRIVSASDDRTTRIWDASTGEQIAVYSPTHPCCLAALWSPGSDRVLVYSNHYGPIIIIDPESGEQLVTLDGHDDGIWAAIWSDDGNRILSGSLDGTARIWDSWTGKELNIFRGHSADVNAIEWSPSEDRIVTASADGTAKVWSIAGPTVDFEIPVGGERGDWSPTNDLIARSNTVEEGHEIQIFDAGTGELKLTFPAYTLEEKQMRQVAFSPSGQSLLTISGLGPARVWNIEDGTLSTELFTEPSFNRVSWSPDGTRFATSTFVITLESGLIQIWDAQSGVEILSFDQHTRITRGLAWSPDGRRIASTSDAGDLLIWDPATGDILFELLPEGSGLRTGNPAWSADGARLAAYRDDGFISVWDSNTGELLQSISEPGGLASWLSWFPSGDRLLTASEGNDIKVWDVEKGSEVLSLTLFGSDAGLSPDGQRFLANIDSGGPLIAFNIWESLDELVSLAKECCVIRELTPNERAQFGLDESEISAGN